MQGDSRGQGGGVSGVCAQQLAFPFLAAATPVFS